MQSGIVFAMLAHAAQATIPPRPMFVYGMEMPAATALVAMLAVDVLRQKRKRHRPRVPRGRGALRPRVLCYRRGRIVGNGDQYPSTSSSQPRIRGCAVFSKTDGRVPSGSTFFFVEGASVPQPWCTSADPK